VWRCPVDEDEDPLPLHGRPGGDAQCLEADDADARGVAEAVAIIGDEGDRLKKPATIHPEEKIRERVSFNAEMTWLE